MLPKNLRPTLIFVLILTFMLLACGLPALPGVEPAGEPGCGDVTLAASTALPGAQVGVTDLPAASDLSAYAVEWVPPNDGEPFDGLMFANQAGAVLTVAPPHPAGLDGGDLTFRLLHEETLCAELPLTIEALAPAPGAYQEIVDLTGDFVARQRERLGVTREELLKGDLTDAGPQVVAAALMQTIYDGPDNPNSLVRLADGSAPIIAAEGGLDWDMLDAMVAEHDIGGWMRQQLAAPVAGGASSVQSRRPTNLNPLLSKPSGRAWPAAQTYDFPAALSQAMQDQAECEGRLTGARGQVRTDAELAAVGAGLFSTPAGLAAGGALLLWRVVDESCAYTLPGDFTDIEVDYLPASFPEDYDTVAQGPGYVYRVAVTATSVDWELSGVLIDAALSLVGGPIDRLPRTAQLKGVLEWTATLTGILNNLCGRIETCANQEVLRWPAAEFGPVENLVEGEDWAIMEIRPAPQDAVAQEGPFSFVPAGLGRSTIDVRVNPDAFGGNTISAQIPMEVAPITVHIEPKSVQLTPGMEQTFSVTIDNALYPDLNEWTLISPAGDTALAATGAATFTFAAPDFTADCGSESGQTWAISVESTSDTGLRATSSEPRLAQATITVVKDADEDCPTPRPTTEPGALDDLCSLLTQAEIETEFGHEVYGQCRFNASRVDWNWFFYPKPGEYGYAILMTVKQFDSADAAAARFAERKEFYQSADGFADGIEGPWDDSFTIPPGASAEPLVILHGRYLITLNVPLNRDMALERRLIERLPS